MTSDLTGRVAATSAVSKPPDRPLPQLPASASSRSLLGSSPASASRPAAAAPPPEEIEASNIAVDDASDPHPRVQTPPRAAPAAGGDTATPSPPRPMANARNASEPVRPMDALTPHSRRVAKIQVRPCNGCLWRPRCVTSLHVLDACAYPGVDLVSVQSCCGVARSPTPEQWRGAETPATVEAAPFTSGWVSSRGQRWRAAKTTPAVEPTAVPSRCSCSSWSHWRQCQRRGRPTPPRWHRQPASRRGSGRGWRCPLWR